MRVCGRTFPRNPVLPGLLQQQVPLGAPGKPLHPPVRFFTAAPQSGADGGPGDVPRLGLGDQPQPMADRRIGIAGQTIAAGAIKQAVDDAMKAALAAGAVVADFERMYATLGQRYARER